MNRVEALKELIRYSTYAELIMPSVLIDNIDTCKYHTHEALERLNIESDLELIVDKINGDEYKVIISLKENQQVNFHTIEIDYDKCDKCYDCVNCCPTNALTVKDGVFLHNAYECSYCEVCKDVCEQECLEIKDM